MTENLVNFKSTLLRMYFSHSFNYHSITIGYSRVMT